MAAFDKFLIAPLDTGLQLNVKPWLISNDSYAQLDNAYMFRGRVVKRFGSYLMGYSAPADLDQLHSRLRINIGPTAVGTGNLAGFAPPGATGSFGVGQAFSIGPVMYTVVTAGAVVPMLQTTVFIGVTAYGTVPISGNLTTNTFAIWAGPYAIGQVFTVSSSLGTETFTIASVLPGAQPLTPSGTGSGTFNAATGALIINSPSTVSVTVTSATVRFIPNTATATFSTTNGAFNFVGAEENTDVYFYPAQPVMGLTQFGPNSAINDKPAYAFDQQFAYVYGGGFWNRVGTAVWHGDDTDFFWASNWEGVAAGVGGTYQQAMFVTNFNASLSTVGPIPIGPYVFPANDDPIRYLIGTTWTNLLPYFLPIATQPFGFAAGIVTTSRIVVPFKNRLVLLNTIEATAAITGPNVTFTSKSHVNRARWCHSGSPFAYNAWYESSSRDAGGNVGDGGGYLDASTDEAIISAEFIKDRLIVFFERSTWELAYTDNELQPFLWQKLNTELGCQATFSSVPFDQFVLSVGQTGVHACNGSNVERIDSKIPDEVFKIQNPSGGSKRVHGIRDYYTEMVYWCFPKDTQFDLQPYPQRVLVYNYQNKSWAFNNDSITAFGYFEQQTAPTWASTTIKWQNANMTWDSGTLQANFRQVIAGNQEGYTFIIDSDTSRNASAMQITNLTYVNAGGDSTVTLTVMNHNLKSTVIALAQGDYVLLENIIDGKVNPADPMPNIGTIINDTIHEVSTSSATPNTFEFVLEDTTLTGTYLGAGTVARVSNINIKSREWNPYIDKGKNVLLNRIDFAVARTSNGEITVDYSPSSATNMSMISDSMATQSIMGTNVLETHPYIGNAIEQQSERLWHSVYFQGQGECIQIFMYLSDTQMRNTSIALEDFEIEALVLNTQPASEFIQSGGM